ncbi:polyprenyl diphosphate synthase [Streptomyces olivaceus]|uniref:polyprenyl diphosphate synthase n=1 Tax=Streptomyces olivaceus TaxID=47716 RepID=UPI001CCB3764|nr:polyprenyl diphosphate synthase [Streptomyces olivaceus]MBZ6135526.1 di-trans,poly-cis-decaprenylcistransferase [Streptomyces olivaceus]
MTDETLHVALILDGNGRWARMRGLQRSDGHLQAQTAVKSVVDAALECNVTHLTLFAFSTENWSRSAEEVALLMQPERWLMTPQQVTHYRDHKVHVTFLGDREDIRLPARCTRWIRSVEEETSQLHPRLRLSVAFNYGGRQEITEAIRRAHLTSGGAGSEHAFQEHLWSRGLPDIDLCVRTSGEHRLSNFMLWSMWYAELIFTKTLWPDYRGSDLVQALDEFRQRNRRWGTAPSSAHPANS